MGIFGWGKNEAAAASDRAAARVPDVVADPQLGTALERAHGPQEDGIGGAANKLIARLMRVGIDGAGPFDSASKVATDALKQSGGDVDRAITYIERDHRQMAGVGGFLTGLGGFFTMPVSLPANILEFYLLATRQTAATAQLRGYDISQPEIRTAILLALVGADSDDLLKKAGVQAVAGGKLGAMALERLPKAALMVINKAIGFRLLGRVGQGVFSRLGRAVPVVGGAVGAGVDIYMLNRIADAARREFPLASAARALGTSGTPGA